MARHDPSRSYPPSTLRFTRTTHLPSSRFRRSCTDAWARIRAKCSRAGSTRVRAAADRRLSVFVGAPRGRSSVAGLPLAEAYALARAAPNLVLGGIAIAERHVAKEDEHQRMLAKQDAGCRFFITQSVYDAASTKSLLSDYALSLQACGRSPAPVVLTFSPCGSVRTLEFMKWLGISFPRWLENELRHSADTLERSIDLCESVLHRRAGLCARKALANRHQRRERLHSKVGGRRVGGALSAIELTSGAVGRSSPSGARS